MKSCDEMVNSLIERRDKYNTERKKRKNLIVKISSPVLCLAIAVGVIFMFPELKKSAEKPVADIDAEITETIKSKSKKTDKDEEKTIEFEKSITDIKTTSNNEIGTDKEKSNTEKKSSVKEPHEGDKDTDGISDFAYFFWKNNIVVSGSLRSELNNNKDGVIEIYALYRPFLPDITEFTYDGKTLYELSEEVKDESSDKELQKIYNIHVKEVLLNAEKQLRENNIKCERKENTNNCLKIYVTAEEFENLPLDHLSRWNFDLAFDR